MNWLEQLFSRDRTPYLTEPKQWYTYTDTPPNSVPGQNPNALFSKREQLQTMLSTIGRLNPYQGPLGMAQPMPNGLEGQILNHIFKSVPKPLLHRLLMQDLDGDINGALAGTYYNRDRQQRNFLDSRGIKETDFRTTPEMVNQFPIIGRIM